MPTVLGDVGDDVQHDGIPAAGTFQGKGGTPMGAPELSALLWRERELLELLLFKLEEEQLLLTSGKSRWLHFATREVESVLDRLRTIGLDRAAEVDALAAEWGMSHEATLREIVALAPQPAWADTFQAHLTALASLTGEIAAVRDANLVFLRAANRSTQESLAQLSPEGGSYGAPGQRGPRSAHLFDEDA